MYHYLDMVFLLLTSALCFCISYKMLFGFNKVVYIWGGLVLAYVGGGSAFKFIDRFKGDLGNSIDFNQDLSYFLAALTVIMFLKAVKRG